MDKKSFIRALFVAVAVAAFGAAACGGGAPKAPDAPTGASTAPPATPDHRCHRQRDAGRHAAAVIETR